MSNPPNADALPQVLQKAQEAKDQVESNARDLFVVNEVLKQKIPAPIKVVGDVAAALERSEAIQEKLDTVVDGLDEVNQALAREVARRKLAEHKLSETKADLADTKAQLSDAKDQQ